MFRGPITGEKHITSVWMFKSSCQGWVRNIFSLHCVTWGTTKNYQPTPDPSFVADVSLFLVFRNVNKPTVHHLLDDTEQISSRYNTKHHCAFSSNKDILLSGEMMEIKNGSIRRVKTRWVNSLPKYSPCHNIIAYLAAAQGLKTSINAAFNSQSNWLA